MKRTLVIVTAVISLGLGACASGKSDIAAQKDRFQTDMESKLSEIGVRVSNMRENVIGAPDSARVEFDAQIDDIAELKEELGGRIARIDEATDQQWAAVKESIETQYEQLEDKVDQLSEKLGDSAVGQL